MSKRCPGFGCRGGTSLISALLNLRYLWSSQIKMLMEATGCTGILLKVEF